MRRAHIFTCIIGVASCLSGCAVTSKSNTSRTASEQVLLSSAIDRALSNVHFHQVASKSVFVDDKYLDSVDKGYLVGSVRHKVLAAGGRIAADAATADLVLELRSGGVGTDMEQSFVGIPAIGVPGLPIELPEIKLISKDNQRGTAKIGIVAYDPKSGEAVGLGGESTALADNENMYVLGIGPFKSGAVKEQMESAVGAERDGSSLSEALGVQPPPRKRARPVGLVDASKISPAFNVSKLPALPASHRK
ncbi:MAG: DUF6655 family protein [Aureliella sp.]